MLLICFIEGSLFSCLLLDIYSAVVNLRFLDIVRINATLFVNIIYIDSVVLIYLYCIYDGIATLVTASDGDVPVVVFPFSDSKSGTNISISSIFWPC